jgi:hypothetical protein
MKIFIVGKHSSGKLAALQCCEALGVKVGREFSNLPEPNPHIYMDPKYNRYTVDDIDRIFELGAYICIGGIDESHVLDSYTYYRGISQYDYDDSDVMVLSPGQLENLNRKLIQDRVLFVWMDNTLSTRIRRHAEEGRLYSFAEEEEIESRPGADFVKLLYSFPNSDVLYFTNEDPARVGTIISAIVKYPDLLKSFIDNFNG